MSVIKSKRTESTMQFLETARELARFTKQQCINFPKRYTFFGGQRTYDCAYKMLENVKKGNSTFPRNTHEVQVRRDYFMAALAELNALCEYIDDARSTFPIKDTIMLQWLTMVTDEMRLIKAIMQKDKERYDKATFSE